MFPVKMRGRKQSFEVNSKCKLESKLCFKVFNGLVVKALDSQSRGSMFKITQWFEGDLTFYLSEVDQMSTRNFSELSGKK